MFTFGTHELAALHTSLLFKTRTGTFGSDQ